MLGRLEDLDRPAVLLAPFQNESRDGRFVFSFIGFQHPTGFTGRQQQTYSQNIFTADYRIGALDLAPWHANAPTPGNHANTGIKGPKVV